MFPKMQSGGNKKTLYYEIRFIKISAHSARRYSKFIIQHYLTMARTTLSHPFDSMSGKLGSSDKIIMRTRNGRTHAYVVKHPYKGPVAPERQRTIIAFADAVNQTTVILNTPELRLEWEEKFAAYRKKADRYPNSYPKPYTTLRGFIIGSLIQSTK